jgi:chitin synthase
MAAVPLVSHTQPRALAAPREIDDRRAFAPSAMDITDDKYAYADTQSLAGTETYPPSRAIDTKETDILADGDVGDNETTEVYKESLARRRWVWLCWALTFWIPGFVLSSIGRMKRPDVRQAWREKLAINMIIWFICACTIFVIAILGPLICPTQHVYSTSELAAKSYQNDPNNALVAVRGEVFDLSQLATYHVRAVSVVPNKMVMQYGGLDATTLFPVQVSALCAGTTGSLSQWVTLDTTNTTDVFQKYHDFRAYTNDSRPDWYAEQMMVMRARYRKGFMGFTKKDIKSMSQSRNIAIYRDKVYDMTTYRQQNGGGLKAPNGTEFTAQDTADRQFMSPAVLSLFTTNAGQDITNLFDGLASEIGQDVVNWQRDCLRNLFLIGEVDTRDSPQCQFSTYILLVLSIIMVTIIGFKFLAALHFGSSRAPENHDKFVICQVPCYTEGEDSLRRTIDSLVKTRYDDKRKLLMVVCDGNIKGFGNDKPTPAIVLDILGVDPTAADPEPLSFQSLGEGAKQHNMGKVYAGLYECSGHVVPYIVIVKVGKPAEKNRPGNRGKRDSQMIIMHFLNKVRLLHEISGRGRRDQRVTG